MKIIDASLESAKEESNCIVNYEIINEFKV
jgi:hypothetical protein